jgi:hypothetical protein
MLAIVIELSPPLVRSVVNAAVCVDCCCPTLTDTKRRAVIRLLVLSDAAESETHNVTSTVVWPNPIRTDESNACATLDPSTVTLSAAVAGLLVLTIELATAVS